MGLPSRWSCELQLPMILQLRTRGVNLVRLSDGVFSIEGLHDRFKQQQI